MGGRRKQRDKKIIYYKYRKNDLNRVGRLDYQGAARGSFFGVMELFWILMVVFVIRFHILVKMFPGHQLEQILLYVHTYITMPETWVSSSISN